MALACVDPTRPVDPAPNSTVQLLSGAPDGPVMVRSALLMAVQVSDTTGAPLVGRWIYFVGGTGGPIADPESSLSDAEGRANSTVTLGNAAGLNRVYFGLARYSPLHAPYWANLSPGSLIDSIDVTTHPGPLSELRVVAGDSQTALPGAALPVAPEVQAYDAFENRLGGVTVLFTPDGGSSVTPAAVVTDSVGFARTTWTLGTTSGVWHTLIATADGIAPVFFHALALLGPPRSIRLYMDRPNPPLLHASTFFAVRAVSSSPGIIMDSLVITVRDRRMNLPWYKVQFEGWMDLTGLPADTMAILASAYERQGGRIDLLVPTWRDDLPVVSVQAPTPLTFAAPSVRVQASCADDWLGCTIRVRAKHEGMYSATTVAQSATNAMDTLVSLAPFDGHATRVIVEAVDVRGQVDAETVVVHVEASPHLEPFTTADGTVWDVTASRVLYELGGAAPRMVVRTLDQSMVDSLPMAAGHTAHRAFLFVNGAIVTADSPYPRWLYHLNAGVVGTVQDIKPRSLEVGGDYAIYARDIGSGLRLYRRHLVTGTDVLVHANPAYDVWHDVSEAGDVVYVQGSSIWEYRAGTNTNIAFGAPYQAPLTDGLRIVFRREESYRTHTIMLFESDSVRVLSALPFDYVHETAPRLTYDARGGWIAYSVLGANDTRQIRLRAADGTERQVTDFGTHSEIAAMGDDGTIVVANGGRRYLSRPGQSLVDVGGNQGRMIWRNGRYYLLLDRTVLRVR